MVGAQFPETLTAGRVQDARDPCQKNNGRHFWRPFEIDHRVEEKQRPWQAWQRPTLPSLEA
jgi:hypothetical protein